MGQRHQVLVIMPKGRTEDIVNSKYDSNKPESNEPKYVKRNVIGLHHQWLYGVTAGKMLAQFLKWAETGRKDEFFILSEKGDCASGTARDAISSIYSVLPSEGYYHRVSIEESYLSDDFAGGDNNDGITIIDVTGKKPKYAMMLFSNDEDNPVQVKPYTPLDIDTYISTYYNEEMLNSKRSYWNPEDEAEKAERVKEMQHWLKERAKIKRATNRFEVLTMDEIMAHFPRMILTMTDKERESISPQLSKSLEDIYADFKIEETKELEEAK